MNTFLRAIAGIILIGGFFYLLAQGLNYLQKPTPLENIEKRLDEAAEKDSILTDNELELKTKSQTKEWEEVDKQTDK